MGFESSRLAAVVGRCSAYREVLFSLGRELQSYLSCVVDLLGFFPCVRTLSIKSFFVAVLMGNPIAALRAWRKVTLSFRISSIPRANTECHTLSC